jgi:DNA-binding transcriptional regulator YdaS (Cro superfamily)
MTIVLKILDFCNLLDYTGTRLSITNIALIGLVTRLAVTKDIDWPSLVAVITAFGNYAHKRTSGSSEDTDK